MHLGSYLEYILKMEHSSCNVLGNTTKHNVLQGINHPRSSPSNLNDSMISPVASSTKRQSLDIIEESPTAKSTNVTFRRFANSIRNRSRKKKEKNETTKLCFTREVVVVQHKEESSLASTIVLHNDDEDLPATQPVISTLLTKVIAFVEVKICDYNRSSGVKDQLRKLGATVLDSLTQIVTHVVFHDGTLATYKKAVKYRAHLVSVAWIEACKNKMSVMPAHLYPPDNLEKYSSPSLVRKIKPMKRDIYLVTSGSEKEDQKWDDRLKLIQEDLRKKTANQNLVSSPLSAVSESRVISSKAQDPPLSVGASCDMIKALRRVAGSIDPKYQEYVRRPTSPTSDEEATPIPLAVRLLRQFMSPKYIGESPENIENNKSSESVDSIEEHLKLMFQTPVQTNPTNDCKIMHIDANKPVAKQPMFSISPTNSNLLQDLNYTPVSTNRRKSMRHQLLFAKTPQPCTPSAMDISEDPLQTEKASNKETSTSSLTSTQKKRKLYNIVRMDESPKLIPIIEDEVDVVYSGISSSFPKSQSRSRRNLTDMELTECMPGRIIQTDPKKFLSKTLTGKKTQDNSKKEWQSRRSSWEFKQRKSTRTQITSNLKQPHTLVCTGLPKDELISIMSAVTSLGVFTMANNVIASTTHVVCTDGSRPRRTVNLLKAIARGCWVVSKSWVLDSLQAGKWLNEELYEVNNFSAAVQQCRIEKLSFGPAYRLCLFSNCGLIFIRRDSKPPVKDLTELVQLCGGNVTKCERKAHLIVGRKPRAQSDVLHLSEKWLLDTVSDATLRPMQEYKL